MYVRAAAFAGLVLTALTYSTVEAQSADATATVTVVAAGTATVLNTAGLDFGTQATGQIVNSTDVPTAASWNVTFNAGGDYSFSFTLPTQLSSPATGGSVPITFGNTSASSPFLFPGTWDPAIPIGIQAVLPGSGLDIFLGASQTGAASDDVSVNLTGAAAGTYTGVVTLTVAPL